MRRDFVKSMLLLTMMKWSRWDLAASEVMLWYSDLTSGESPIVRTEYDLGTSCFSSVGSRNVLIVMCSNDDTIQFVKFCLSSETNKQDMT